MLAPLIRLTRHDLREIFRNSWCRWPAAIAVALAPLTVHVGTLDYQARQRDYLAYMDRLEQARQGGRKIVTGTVADATLRAVRPPSPGSVFVRGLDDMASPYWDFTPTGVKTAPGLRSRASIFDAGATVDLGFLLRTVLGLIAIAAGASSLARDQQRGTLKAMLCAPLHRRFVIVGRMLGGVLAIGAIALAIAFAGTTAALVSGAPFSPLDIGVAVGGMAGLAVLHGAVLFFGGLIVAELTRTEAAAMTGALVGWLTISLLLAPGAALVGRAIVPVPALPLVEGRRDLLHATMAQSMRERLGDELRRLIGPDRDPLRVEFAGEPRAALEASAQLQAAAIRRKLDEIDAEVGVAIVRQQSVVNAIARISPSGLFLDAAANLAGTGEEVLWLWQAAADRYQDTLQAAIFDSPPRMYVYPPSPRGRTVIYFERWPEPTIADLPEFRVPEVTAAVRWGAAARSVLVLVVFCAATGVAAIAFFRYRPVRKPGRGS